MCRCVRVDINKKHLLFHTWIRALVLAFCVLCDVFEISTMFSLLWSSHYVCMMCFQGLCAAAGQYSLSVGDTIFNVVWTLLQKQFPLGDSEMNTFQSYFSTLSNEAQMSHPISSTTLSFSIQKGHAFLFLLDLNISMHFKVRYRPT